MCGRPSKSWWQYHRLESRQDQLKEQVTEAFSANVDEMQGILNTARGEMTTKNDAFEVMVSALKE